MCNRNARKRGKREKNRKKFETIMTENFSKLMSGTKPLIREIQRIPSWVNNSPKLYLGTSFSNYKKIEDKRKNYE